MEIVAQLNSSVIYVIGFTVLIGLIFSKKYWGTPPGYILIYLVLLLLVEYYGGIISNNHWMYNIQSFAEFLIVSLIFYYSVQSKTSKNIIIVLAGICFTAIWIELLLITKTYNMYLSYGFGLVSFAIPLMCLVYLFQLANSEKILNQNRVLLYWMSIGLMIYHLCNLPTTVLINDIFNTQEYNVLYSIQSLSSFMMYSCFIIGFIWSQRKYNI
ncbi:MAG: hypothetical protein AAGA77_23905, partial [Bacteroidota bacterium]